MSLRNKPVCMTMAALLASLAMPALAQNGGPGPDLDPGGLGTQRVDLPDINDGSISVHANLLGNAGSGGLTQMAVTSAFADSLFFSDRDGQVRRFDISTGTASVLFNVGDRRTNFQVNGPASGQGLRGLAFHPDFNNAGKAGYGKIYTAFEEVFNSAPSSGDRILPTTTSFGGTFASDGNRQDGVIVEWDYDFNTNTVVAGSGRDVYRIQTPYGDHPLQQIAFNPHAQQGDADYGLLYAGIGDGGGPAAPGPGVDQNRVGQDFRTPLSSIIRIDPIQQSGANPFGTPNDNPFAGPNEDPNIAGEIYAKGFRHPQTLGFDPRNGNLFVGDIGQNNIDEINLVQAGGNYGYGLREGTYIYLDQRLVDPNQLAPISSGTDGLTPNAQPQNADISLFEIPLNSSTQVTITETITGSNANTGFQDVTLDGTRQITIGPRSNDGFLYPTIQVDHVENALNGLTAIVGGYVYDGVLAEELEGLYLFGFLSNNTIAYADADQLDNDGNPTQSLRLQFEDEFGNDIEINQALGTGARTLMRFGQDTNGDIYVFSQITGNIVRLEGTPVPEPGSLGVLGLGGLLALRRRRS